MMHACPTQENPSVHAPLDRWIETQTQSLCTIEKSGVNHVDKKPIVKIKEE
jgi:hypothetical protein